VRFFLSKEKGIRVVLCDSPSKYMGVLFIFLLVFLASAIVDTKEFINKINYLSLIIVDANIIIYFLFF
jgi:hypothetical protein